MFPPNLNLNDKMQGRCLGGIIRSNLSWIPPNHHADYTGHSNILRQEMVDTETGMS